MELMDWVPFAVIGGVAVAFYVRKKYKEQIAASEALTVDRALVLGIWLLSDRDLEFTDGDVFIFAERLLTWKDSQMLISQKHVQVHSAAAIAMALGERQIFLNPQDMAKLIKNVTDNFATLSEEFRHKQGCYQIQRSFDDMNRKSDIEVV
ncbi:MAG: hypothetical protein ACRC6V_00700 [Bacteroidales bacterium]